jgi:tetratricopeptide (TPR) repeat protein
MKPAQVEAAIVSIRGKYVDLLRERPENEAFVQVCARSLARAGDPEAGARLLQESLDKDGVNYSVLLNLGQLLAIQGRLREAQKTLEQGYLRERTPAGHWLCAKVLWRIAIEVKDRHLLEAVWPQMLHLGLGAAGVEVVKARARLWWDEPVPADVSLQSYDLAPEGEAIACLARWRLHEIQPGDVEAMTDSLKRNPDAAGECLIARAMALVSTGHPNRAVMDCLDAEQRLEERAPCEFWAFQTMQLAKACYAKALWAAGRKQEAVELARRLLKTLRPGLLPYILASQVVRGAAG